MVDKNNCTNRMRYAKKVRLALALLIKMVAMVVEVYYGGTSTPGSNGTETITRDEINNMNTRCNAQS